MSSDLSSAPGQSGSPVECLISRNDLERRIGEMAETLADDFAELEQPLVLISVLKGSTLFLSDLIRKLPIEVSVDFMSISSYAEGEQSGVVRIVKDLDVDVSGRDVLIVEDIVDTGLTLNYLRTTLSHRNPKSLRAVTLLDKLARRIVPVELEYSCFEVPDVFVIGYGLDFQGLYRNVPEIFAVRDLPRLLNDPTLLSGTMFWGIGSP
ncbi:MAG: hypoxanthine phosphoribosyltransferase [Actinomycetota bacterium]|nr:hypoxanthine phosphoribosyltransferase [Actinomycetota bacterium]